MNVWAAGSGRNLERLLTGLRGAGYTLFRQRGELSRGLVMEVARGGERLRIVVRPLLTGGHGPDESSMRVRIPRRIGLRDSQVESVVLGFEPRLEVFAGWPRSGRFGVHWIPRRLLREAAEEGFARAHRRDGAVAFAPERIGDYLDLPRRRARRLTPERYEKMRRENAKELAAGRAAYKLGPPRPVLSSPQRRGRLQALKKQGRARKEIESGFVAAGAAQDPLSGDFHLACGKPYLYWFAIGTGFGASIERTPTPPPRGLPAEARLTVKVLAFPGELQLNGPTRGELEMRAGGQARVSEPAVIPRGAAEWGSRVLFFKVRTPEEAGVYRLRCNLYHGSTLLQSRLVTCRVGPSMSDDPEDPGLRSELDYVIADRVDLGSLAQVPQHDLSLMVNGGGPTGERTHQFRFFQGDDERFDADISLEEEKVTNGIRHLRNALRRASWNTEEEFKPKNKNRYPNRTGDPRRFAEDLIRMARRGHDFYLEVTGKMSSGERTRAGLEAVTKEPCRIQIARAKEGLYLPAALFYDHPLETAPSAADEKRFKLCDQFLSSLDDRTVPLEESPCILGRCPNHHDVFVICPGGFWGFRHEIGWPVSGSGEPRTEVPMGDQPEMVIGVSTDRALELREEHVKKILALGDGEVARNREKAAELLGAGSLHLVYFYCHGGVTKPMSVPFLELGSRGSSGFNRAFLNAQKIRWNTLPRPIVFINGCRTTALEPESFSTLVAAFVEDARALGVIGTEVTVFEPLACAFAQGVLGEFLPGSMTIGQAIRRTRFELLRDRNPLGIVYVPFVAAATRLVKEAT